MSVKDLKPPQIIGVVAILLFAISFFLPAYAGGYPGEMSGWECFRLCFETFPQPFLPNDDNKIPWVEWGYYSSFTLANIGFPILIAALFTSKKRQLLHAFISVALLLQVLSWWFQPDAHMHIIDYGFKTSECLVGYYVWLAAFFLLTAAHLIKSSKSLKPTVGTSVS